MSELLIKTLDAGEFLVCSDLTFDTVAALVPEAAALLLEGQQNVFNLGAVERADSAALAWMLELTRLSSERQLDIAFVALPEQLNALVALSELEHVFSIL